MRISDWSSAVVSSDLIGCAYDMETVAIGASIACSGACLTVVEKGADWFAVDLSAETVARTAPGLWELGGRLNLERALKVGDELGGHIVTGHVDGIGTLVSAAHEGDSTRLIISAPAALAPALAATGSITVDGISLPVNTVEDQADGSVHFGLNIIPPTAAATTPDRLKGSQERRAGKRCLRKCRSRWSPYPYQKKLVNVDNIIKNTQ